MRILVLYALLAALALAGCHTSVQEYAPGINQDPTAPEAYGQNAAAQAQAPATRDPTLAAAEGPVPATATADGLPSKASPTPTATALLPSPTPPHTPTTSATDTPTPEPAATSTPAPTVEPTATYWPTVTRQVLPVDVAMGLLPCGSRAVTGDLLEMVTQQFALPETYAPADLVPLNDYFSSEVTRDQTLYVRASIIEPLKGMVSDMQAAGLQPSLLSAYRSYQEQALAWHWWSGKYPDRVAIMSARPGSSEHQLGMTVDFGSPELDHLFHVDFANTAEGIWLANNAYRYGFTLSFPANSYAITGFKYEPWHYRYVGTELAAQLYQTGQILTQWQLANLPVPCIP